MCTSGEDALPIEHLGDGPVAHLINFSDGQPHIVRLCYVPGQLDLYLDDLSTPQLSVPYDIARGASWTSGGKVGGLDLLAGSTAYVGFTAGNGAAFETHDILWWKWVSRPAARFLPLDLRPLGLSGLLPCRQPWIPL